MYETGSGLCGFTNGAVCSYVTPGTFVRIYTDFVGEFESMCRQSSKEGGKVGKSILHFLIPFHRNSHKKFGGARARARVCDSVAPYL